MPRAPETGASVSLTRNQEGQWFFEVIGPQGDIVLLSEAYSSRASALNGALSAQENGVSGDRYELNESAAGFGFVLKAGNGEILAEGQTFATQGEADAAAQSARDLVADYVQYQTALDDGAMFELSRPSGSEWEFALNDENGRPLLKSQIYSRRRDAINGVESVRKNGQESARYEILGDPARFIIKAANGQEIAESSSSFSSPEAAQAAADATQALLVSERVANPW